MENLKNPERPNPQAIQVNVSALLGETVAKNQAMTAYISQLEAYTVQLEARIRYLEATQAAMLDPGGEVRPANECVFPMEGGLTCWRPAGHNGEHVSHGKPVGV